MLEDVLAIVGVPVRLLGLCGILLVHVPWAVPVMIELSAPVFYIGYRGGKQVYDAKRETTKLDRAAKNFSEILFSRENIDERSIYGYEPAINARYVRAFGESRLHNKSVYKKNFIAMKAGSVVVMDAGKIVDVGTHDELMSRKGLYSDMFAAQSSWYKNADAM